MHEADIVVIGAGAAGVAAVRRLSEAPLSILWLEARSRVGGRAWSWKSGNLSLDLGCGWLHSADKNEWVALAPQCGLDVDMSPSPWSPPMLLGNFSVDDQDDYTAAWKRFYTRISESASGIDRPISELLEPSGRWNSMLEAMATYFNGAETEKLSAHEYAVYQDSGMNARVRGGYGTLVEIYATGLDVRLDCPVTEIDHASTRLRIVTASGEITARAAVVTVPPPIIANETLHFFPELPQKSEAAHNLPLGFANKVFLSADSTNDFPADTRVLGSTTSIETGSYVLRPFGWPVIEGYFGGKFARALELESAVGSFAVEELVNLLGHDMRKRLSIVAESAWANDPFSLGSYSYGSFGAKACRARLAAPVDGRIFFAGEHCSEVDFSTAHGAYRTGVKAAEDALEALQPPRGQLYQRTRAT